MDDYIFLGKTRSIFNIIFLPKHFIIADSFANNVIKGRRWRVSYCLGELDDSMQIINEHFIANFIDNSSKHVIDDVEYYFTMK